VQPPAQPPATLSAWQNYDGGPGKIVQSASLSNSVAGAEMHVELRTSPIGPLEVHTVVHDGSVGAEIHVQSSEAHTLLTAGLPSLERALGERNLRVENLNVYQDLSGGGTSGGGAHDAQSGSHPSMQRQTLPWDNSPQSDIPTSSSMEEEEPSILTTGLSVRV
jgi:flagellar hook-length control protein FliK